MPDKQIHKLIPALRFPDFANDGEWDKDAFENTFLFLPNNTLSRAELNYEKGSTKNVHYGDVLIRFGDCLDVQTNVLPFISDEAIADKLQRSRLQDGDVVIADTAEDEAVGKCTEVFNMSGENVVSGLHTIPVRPKKQFAIPYLGFYFNSDSYRKQLLPLMQGVKVMSISKTAISKTIVAYPNLLSEQCKIGSCLSSMDAYISATKAKLELLKTYKKGLMQKLFPAKGKKLPELRFKEFEKDGEWEEKKYEDCLDYEQPQSYLVSSENYKKTGVPVLTAGKTFILGFTDETFGVYTKLPVIIFDDFTTDSRFVDFPFKAKSSAMKMLSVKEGYDLRFIFATMQNNEFKPHDHQRHWISIYSKFKVEIPSLAEQRKIAGCLTSIDDMINQYTNKVSSLELYKKGLMQQLFPTSK